MCLYPRFIMNRKYVKNKKNKGVVPKLPRRNIDGVMVEDRRVLEVPIGCGKCMECMRQKKNNWKVRLQEEIKSNKMKAHFVTFTFSNEDYQDLYERYFEDSGIEGYLLDNEIAKKSVRLFLERWRKSEKKSVKHWLITELGHEGTENIHMHGILWTDKSEEFIKKKWGYGFVWVGDYVNDKTVNYIVKYCTKLDSDHENFVPSICTSAGIGRGYFDRGDWENLKYKGEDTDSGYQGNTGYKMNLPVYYRNKIYNEKQREKLWIDMIEKDLRYVDGAKIDMGMVGGVEEYYRRLGIAREKNERLGYGSDEKNWKKMSYENRRRKLNHESRMNKVRTE